VLSYPVCGEKPNSGGNTGECVGGGGGGTLASHRPHCPSTGCQMNMEHV